MGGMMKAGLVVLMTSVLTGCAVCRERPVACAVAVVAVGVIVAHELDRGRRGPRAGQQTPPGQCPLPDPNACR